MVKEFQIKAKMSTKLKKIENLTRPCLFFLQKFENSKNRKFPHIFASKLYLRTETKAILGKTKYFCRKHVECSRFLRNDFFVSWSWRKFAWWRNRILYNSMYQ
jgi:hypothetical protein